jgi:type VII secretion integral membrane protein EccD
VQPPPGPIYARVTLLVAGRRVDVALPVDVTLAELVPMVLELARPPGGRRPPVPWRISGVTGGPLPPDATLDELGVLDGDLLRLGPDTPPPPPPVFDDPVDALAAVAAPGGSRDRHRPAVIAVPGIVLAAAALLSGVGSKDPITRSLAPATILLAALGAVGALVAAAVLTRVRGGTSAEARRRAAAKVAAHCAVPLAAVAGWSALPGPPGPARLLVAATAGGAAAALGQVAVRLVAPALVAAVVLAALVAAATAAGLRFPLGVPALTTLAGAVALCTGPVVPRVAVRLGRLSRPVVPMDAAGLVAADTGPDLLSPEELSDRAARARGHLAGVCGGCAVAAAVAAPVAAAPSGWAGRTFGAVVVAALLLRSRGFADPGPAAVHIAAGVMAGVALVGVVARAADAPGQLLGALVLLLGAAAGTAALARAPAASPVARRAVDLLDGVLTAAAVPLALAAAGVFALLRAL